MSRSISGSTAVARRSRILMTSLGASLAAIITIGIVVIAGAPAEASTCTLSSTAPITNWSDTTKWSGCAGTYPNLGDTAQVGLPGSYTLTVDVPVNVVLQITTTPVSLSVQNTMKLEASSTSVSGANVTIPSGGNLQVASSVTLNSFLANITVSGGTLELQGGSQYTIGSFSNFVFNGGQILGPGTLNNPVSTSMAWAGGTSPMALNGALIFNNSGTVNLTSSTNALSINSGSQFNNQSGATFNINTSVPINTDNTNSPAINSDSNIFILPSQNPTFNVPLNNNGTLYLQETGSLQTVTLAGGGTHAGTFNLSSPSVGTIAFNGLHNFNVGFSWTTNPNSVFKLLGGTATVMQSFTTPTLILDGGTMATSSGLTTIAAGTLDWNAGTMTGLGTNSVTGTGNIDGTSPATVNGSHLLSVPNLATLNYNPGAGGGLNFTNSGGMSINGTFDLQGDTTITSDGSATINIGATGLMRKSAGTRTQVDPFVTLTTGGSIKAMGNVLALGGGSNLAGTLDTSNPTSFIEFASNTHNLQSGVNVLSGDLKLTNTGTLNVSTPLSINSLTQSAGTLKGSQTLTTANYNWTGGFLDGDTGGTGSLSVTGVTFINGSSATKVFHKFVFSNGPSATVHYSPTVPLAVDTGGTIVNNGTWILENGTAITSDLTTYLATGPNFANFSSLTKTIGGVTSFGVPLNSSSGIVLNNSSEIDLTGGGTLNGGSVTFNNPGDALAIQTNNVNIAAAPPSVTGPGYVRIDNTGTLTNNSTGATIPNFEIRNGGTLTGSGTLNVTSGFKTTGGTLTGGGTTNIASGVTAGDMTALSGPFTLNNHTLNNSGVLTYGSTQSFQFQGNAHFNNQSTGVFNIVSNGGTNFASTNNTIDNQGTITRSGTPTFFTINIPFTNSGTVDAQVANTFVAFTGGGAMTAGVMKGSVAGAGVEFGGGSFDVTGGNFGTLGALKISGGALNINTAINAPAAVGLVGGTLATTATGTFTLPTGSTMQVTGGTVLNLPMTGNSGSVFNINTTTNPVSFNGSALNHSGTGQWIGGNPINMSNGASLNYFGTYNWDTTANIAQVGGVDSSVSVQTGGSLTKGTSAGPIGVAALLVNSGGTISSTNGALQLNNPNSHAHSGTFNATSPGTIDFTGGSHTFTGVTGTGTGFLRFMGGTITMDATSLTNLYLSAGTLTGTGPLTVSGIFDWDGGNVDVQTTAGTVNFLGGVSLMSLGANMSSGGNFTASVNGFDIGATFTYANNGTFSYTGAASITGGGTFVNNGTLTKTTATSSMIGVVFNNNGTVNANGGTLKIAGGGTDNGSYASTIGNFLEFAGNRSLSSTGQIGSAAAGTTSFTANTFTDNGTFTPSGPVLVDNGATLDLNTVGTATTNAFTLNFGGSLSGTSAVHLTAGTHAFNGGTISGAGALTNSGALTMAANPVTLIGRTLTNASGASIQLSGGGAALDLQNAAIANQSGATFDVQNDSSITNTSGTASISNAGAFNKVCCGALSSIEPIFTNTGSVTAQAGQFSFDDFTQSAGTTTLQGGDLVSPATMNFTGGTLTGDGNLIAAVTNSGATIDPAGPTTTTPAIIGISGNFNQTAGSLIIDLINNGTNDQLQVGAGSSGTLAGNLTLQYVAPYTPANGDSFNVFHANPVTDSSTFTWPPFGPGNVGTFNRTVQSGTDLIVTAVIPSVDIDLSGTTAPTSVVHQNNWVVTIPVKNNSSTNAGTNVQVTITVSNGAFVNATASGGTCTGNVCTFASIAAGASATITANITATTLGTVSATANITAANEPDPTPSNNTATVSATVTPKADLGLTITDSPDPVNAGAAFSYTATVANAGPDSSAATVLLTLTGATYGTLPAGCTNTATPGVISCTTAAIPSGNSTNIVVNLTAPGSGPVTLNGSVTASGATDLNSANNNASQSTTVNASADVMITKTGPTSVFAGLNVVYNIAVKNNGPSDATNVQIQDLTPSGLTFSNASGACSSFPCTIPSITNGSTATITATYSTSPSMAATTVNNTASITGSATPDPNTGNNSSNAATTITPNADLVVLATGPSNAFPGSTVTIQVKVQNAGPSDANSITVNAAVSPSLTFVSNSGACTGAYPCGVGSLPAGQFFIINSTYTVNSGGTTATATYTASAATGDANGSNDSDSVSITTGCPSGPPTALSPANQTGVPTGGVLSWDDTGASKYNIYLGQGANGCSTLYGSVTMGSARITQLNYSGLEEGKQYQWKVEAVTPGCPTETSSCVTFTTVTNCNSTAPQPVSPVNTTVTSPVTFTWTPSIGATLYTVKNAADDSTIGTSATTSLANVIVADGQLTWYVVTDVAGCGQLRSVNATFNTCNVPPAPVAGAVAQAQSGQTYAVQWDRISGVLNYDLEQATNASFTDVHVTTVAQPATDNVVSVSFTRTTSQGAAIFFYRVRARSICAQAFGPYSQVIRVVVLPTPPPSQNPSVTVPVGSNQIVVQQVFVPGINDGIVHTFSATVDKPWLTVEPATGILPAAGITLDVKANPATLPNGTETGTVVVTIFGTTGKTGSLGNTTVTTPVTVNVVTPVVPSSKDLPPDNSLIIPSVGHLDGINSHWQSDIRLANVGGQKLKYALKFTPADPSAGGVKTTTIDVDGGATTALDDIVRNWYGVGTLGESANGVLEVRPLTPSGKGDPSGEADPPSVSKVTVVSSRTYAVSDAGTLGQFIPAIPFSSFISKASQSAAASVLSLQQIAQSSQYRTNVGIVEGSGQPASVLVTVFDVAGKKLRDVPLQIRGGEQMQLNGFLASIGIPTLNDGRIEVKVTSGEGRITAYASVVDNQSLDPLLVSGIKLGAASANRYVLPGVADLNTGLANWRTDMRVFNGGLSSQNATLTFFRQGQAPLTQSLVISAGEIRTLDSIVKSLFGVSDAGGAVHVSTASNSNLVVSGRTYNATSNGTFGQFIPAVTAAESVTTGDRPLQILQIEDSVRYRTNIGIAETTGKPAGVDVEIHLPDTKVTPIFHVDLAANDFQQFNPFRALGLENVYNARVSVRVTTGDGKVTAYGSVVDMSTNDPAFMPGQQ